MLNRFQNREGVVIWKAESASHPEFGDTSYGTAPTSPYTGILVDNPQISENLGTVLDHAAGNQIATHAVRNRVEREISLNMRLSAQTSPLALIDACMQSSGGVLSSLYIRTGPSNRNSNAVRQYADRFCKCARFNLSIQQGQAAMFMPTFFSLGKPDLISSSLSSPSYSDIVGDGTDPFSFAVATSVTFDAGGTSFNARPYITGMQVSYDNGLIRQNSEKDLGDDVVTSLRALQLVEGPVNVQGSFTLDANIHPSVIAAAATAATWQKLGDVAVVIGGSTYTINGFRWNGMSQQGGQSAGIFGWQVNWLATNITRS